MSEELPLSPEDLKEIQEKSNKKLAKRQARYYLESKVLSDNLLVSGQKTEAWEAKFKIYIPADALNPQLCCEFQMKILQLHQEAMFYYNAAQARSQYLAHNNKDEYHHKIKELVDQYKLEGKRLPSAITLEYLANLENMDAEYIAVAAQMEEKYWKSIIDHLSTCRKIVENVSFNISVENKAEQAVSRAQYSYINRKGDES